MSSYVPGLFGFCGGVGFISSGFGWPLSICDRGLIGGWGNAPGGGGGSIGGVFGVCIGEVDADEMFGDEELLLPMIAL